MKNVENQPKKNKNEVKPLPFWGILLHIGTQFGIVILAVTIWFSVIAIGNFEENTMIAATCISGIIMITLQLVFGFLFVKDFINPLKNSTKSNPLKFFIIRIINFVNIIISPFVFLVNIIIRSILTKIKFINDYLQKCKDAKESHKNLDKLCEKSYLVEDIEVLTQYIGHLEKRHHKCNRKVINVIAIPSISFILFYFVLTFATPIIFCIIINSLNMQQEQSDILLSYTNIKTTTIISAVSTFIAIIANIQPITKYINHCYRNDDDDKEHIQRLKDKIVAKKQKQKETEETNAQKQKEAEEADAQKRKEAKKADAQNRKDARDRILQ